MFAFSSRSEVYTSYNTTVTNIKLSGSDSGSGRIQQTGIRYISNENGHVPIASCRPTTGAVLSDRI